MNLSYQEKRIWINLTTQLVIYAVYFFEVWRGTVTLGLICGVIVAIIVMQIALQSLLAITSRPERPDERDIAIERSAYRNAYIILVTALIAFVGVLSVYTFSLGYHGFERSPLRIINALLVVLFVAELGKLVSQLVLYRRNA